MTNSGRIAQAIGQRLAGLERVIIAHITANLELAPNRFHVWVAEHGFVRNENGNNVADFAGFSRWARNGFLALAALALCFEMFAIVLGHVNDNPLAFGISLGVGVVVFGALWITWLTRTIGRISGDLAAICIAASALFSLILLGPPTYQYYSTARLPFMEPSDAHELVAAGIPRYWAMLGFVINTLVFVPFLWMVRLGPALLALVFSKSLDAAQNVLHEIRRLLPLGTPESEAAADRLRQQTEIHSGMLLVLWSALALFTCTLLFSPTVWGLFGGVVIGMVSIIVYWLRESLGFIGNFLTKALYGVATGGLIFICFGYGLCLSALMFAQTWVASKLLFAVMLVAFLVGLFAAVMTMFNSTTVREQEELAAGQGHIVPYTTRATGFDGSGNITRGIVHPKPINLNWLRSPLLWIGIAVLALALWVAVKGNPLAGIGFAGIVGMYFLIVLVGGVGLLVFLVKALSGPKPAPAASAQEAHHG